MKDSESKPDESVEQNDQPPVDPNLEECPICGAVGLPERIAEHDCREFLDLQTHEPSIPTRPDKAPTGTIPNTASRLYADLLLIATQFTTLPTDQSTEDAQ